MTIGALGDVVFSASADVVETFTNLRLTESATYQQHRVHGQQAVIEFTGFAAPQITFDMLLSIYLGVNPADELTKLQDMMEAKTGYPLSLGGDLYGSLWVVTALNTTVEKTYKDGTPVQIKVQVTILGMETE